MIQKTGLKNAPEHLGDQRCFFESGNYPFGYAIILVNQRRFVNPILFFRQYFLPTAYCEDIVLPPPPWASAYSAAPSFRRLLWRFLPAPTTLYIVLLHGLRIPELMLLIIADQFARLIPKCHHIHILVLLLIVECVYQIVVPRLLKPRNDLLNLLHRLRIVAGKQTFPHKCTSAPLLIVCNRRRVHVKNLMFQITNHNRRSVLIDDAFKVSLHIGSSFLFQYKRFIYRFFTPLIAALSGEAVAGYHADGKYYLTKSKREIEYYRKRADEMLANAYPLIEIYRSKRENELNAFLLADTGKPGNRRSILSTLPFLP